MRPAMSVLAVAFSLACAGVAHAGPAAAKARTAEVRNTGPIVASDVLEGAPYRIEIPARWNGELVMLLHGYEPKGAPRQQPWPQNEAAPVFLARGYAVAAPAYRTQGWAVAEALPDIERLRQHFVATYGKPRRTYAAGFSLGGHLALASLEQHANAYSGALSLCGVNLPAGEIFDEGIVTPLVALDFYFPKALSLPSGGLSDPAAPPMVDPAAIEAALAGDEAQANRLAERFDIPRPALSGAMMLYYLILHEMQQRAGGMPVDTTKTVYAGFSDDVAFNRGVRRYAADPAAAAYLQANAPLSGHIAAPVVLQSNVVDQTVPPHFAGRYPELVRMAGRAADLTVLPAVGEGHCDFTLAQIDAAFSVLVDRAGGSSAGSQASH